METNMQGNYITCFAMAWQHTQFQSIGSNLWSHIIAIYLSNTVKSLDSYYCSKCCISFTFATLWLDLVLQVFGMSCTELKESNVNLKLTVVDSIGFGDQIDKTDRYNFSPTYSVCNLNLSQTQYFCKWCLMSTQASWLQFVSLSTYCLHLFCIPLFWHCWCPDNV